MFRLDGKVAILTGSSSGIGRAAAVLFAKQGAKVVLAARSVAGLNETLKMVKEAGGEGIAVPTDTTEEKEVQNLVNTAIKEYGKLDIAFNNAGMQNTGKQIHETKLEDWEEVIRTNLRSCFLCMKYEIPQMFAKGGSIINTTSPAGIVGIPDNAAYCASKAAIANLTRAAAYEYSGKYKIRINAFCPGAVKTPMLFKAWGGNPNAINEDPVNWIKKAPMNYLVEPETVVPGVLYLASDETNFVTGTVLVVDGGFLAI